MTADRPPRPPRTVRVASYNLRGLKDDPAAAAAVVRALDPDVLLLQEAPRHPLSSYRIAGFARSCELMWSGRTRRLAGTSVLTSIRVVATDADDRKLTVAGRLGQRSGNPRGYTVSQVRAPGGSRMTVVSIHLSLIPQERVAHTRQVLSEIAADPDLRGAPLVVGGDLNEPEGGGAWELLGERLRAATPKAPTFPASAPTRRIDAIFVDARLAVQPHQRLSLDPDTQRAATDHLPVWVDLSL